MTAQQYKNNQISILKGIVHLSPSSKRKTMKTKAVEQSKSMSNLTGGLMGQPPIHLRNSSRLNLMQNMRECCAPQMKEWFILKYYISWLPHYHNYIKWCSEILSGERLWWQPPRFLSCAPPNASTRSICGEMAFTRPDLTLSYNLGTSLPSASQIYLTTWSVSSLGSTTKQALTRRAVCGSGERS